MTGNDEMSAAAWLARVDKVLKGADFDRALVSRTVEGVDILPLYSKAIGAARAVRAQLGRWTVTQRVDHPDAASANALAKADLEGGASALTLAFAGSAGARGFGVAADRLGDVLEGVAFDVVSLSLEHPPFAYEGAIEALSDLATRRGYDIGRLLIDCGVDPIGDMARTGTKPADAPIGPALGEFLRQLRGRGFASPVFRADGRIHHEAGSSDAQELAGVLASALSYLRWLEAAGFSLEDARGAISFLLVADADEFMTVAKFRALRRLWREVEAACGLGASPIQIAAETAWRMTTRRDPWVNLLRATTAAFSAAIGGADAITVLPFTAPLGLADAFARRMARNTQIVLSEESNLWRVADPAAGAGGFEALTNALVEQAWSLLQTIERAGGLPPMLESGAWQAAIAEKRKERAQLISRRKLPLTGTTEFPNLAEQPVEPLMPAPAIPESAAEPDFPPLGSFRLAEPVERLRDRAENFEKATQHPVAIFLATLGEPPAFTAREGFARGLFEAGGVRAVAGEAINSPQALAAAFRASGAKSACLCSSDETYALPAGDATHVGDTLAEQAARALKNTGCVFLTLAGRPGDREAAYREAGVDAFIYAGLDLVAFLNDAHARMGLPIERD
ncbi:methylmalonyl-CoA mutase subunit beta [Methylocella tundrae]|uniref:methylmalonyl-CoA mutase subunit beta n=1 Tax=Methylocella tundrae TaxID=227605 RepID=UPI002ADEC588|nr:methylmalonyl-CoA mutase subunit beta [Methylocella tundrae]WPP03034.1 methylmalonyl-CoA mutase subunit beta [Methylocella tundrae]